jgi:hypothetical protein
LFLAALAVMVGSIPASAKDAAPKNQWRVRHKLTNQRHEEGTPLLLRIANHSIQALNGKITALGSEKRSLPSLAAR